MYVNTPVFSLYEIPPSPDAIDSSPTERSDNDIPDPPAPVRSTAFSQLVPFHLRTCPLDNWFNVTS